MLKKLTSQEIFIVIAAIITLLFMYSTIIFSANIDKNEQEERLFLYEDKQDKPLEENRTILTYRDNNE